MVLDCDFVSLVDRWRSVLSGGGRFFLEPDVDVEDSKSHCPGIALSKMYCQQSCNIVK